MYSSAPNTYTWREKGDPMPVLKASRSAKINLLGAVELSSGAVTVEEVAGYTTHQEVLNFIETLGGQATEACPVYVFLDNASIHKHHHIQSKRLAWASQHLYLFHLPIYSPHLNEMERVWKHLKYHLLRRRHYSSLLELCQDIFRLLASFVLPCSPIWLEEFDGPQAAA